MPDDYTPGPRSVRRGALYGPPAPISDDTKPNKPWAFADAESCERAAASRPATWDAEALTFEAVVATPHPVPRADARGAFLEILTVDTLADEGSRDLPVFDSHRGGTARATIGVVQRLRREGDSLVAVLRLSAADDVEPIRQRVADGTIRHVSIGYRVAGWTESTDPQGRRVKTPTAWTLTEVSLVPNPADPNARIRSQEIAPGAPARPGGIPNNRAAEGVTMPDTTTTTPSPEEAERTRRAEIRTLVRAAGLGAEIADDLIDAGADVTRAKAAVFDAVQSRTRSAPIIRTHTAANDDPAVITRRQSDALAVRMAGGECPEDARPYLASSLLDMARDSLTRAGVSVRGLSADEVFTRAAAHGTSDFPLVVSTAMHKTALSAYEAATSPLKSLCRQRVLRDFKTSTSIRLGEMGRLEPIAESGEITHTSRGENGETMRLKTYARGLSVSRELLINDDLGLLGDMTAAFGEAAAQTEADILVDLLLSNPALSDGTAVFHASRGNLAGTGGALGVSTVDAARQAMRAVTGLDGRTLINVTPRFLLVGPEIETEAEAFLTSLYAATTSDVNPFASRLTLMVEPRIAGDRWLIFADPARLPCLQYGSLASAQGVQIQRTEAWDTLGLKFRAFLDFGAGWLDWRGVYQNPGAA
jgi:HK97 family phage prohead protease